jgi:NADH-quinone oxidoreductase subunit I
MNCGLCSEFCPFNAIKMDHDYEISVFNRLEHNIFDKDELGKPLSYYATIRPSNVAEEEQAKVKAKKDFEEGQAEKQRRARLQQE